VLEGSVRKSGDRIRITAQLIDAASNSHLWSKTYDRRVGDLFAVQDEIAGSVATALQATLGGRSVQARAPDSVEAYQSYLHGRFLFNRRLEGDVERAVGYYEEAIAKDPTYARAWAALAGASGLLARPPSGLDIGWLDRQREAALTAVKLDPNLAVAQARLAQYYWQTGQRAKGNAHFDKALALNPDDLLVLGFAAGVARRDGEIDRALEIWNRVVQRDPLSPINRGNYAAMLLEAGRLEEARVEFDKLFELNPDAGPEDRVQLVCVLTLLKRYDEAQALIAQLPDGEYRDFGLALQYEAPGRRAEADAALRRLRSQPADYRGSIRLAEAYAIRGRREDAFEVLQRRRAALERGDPSDVYQLWYFLDDTQANHLLKPLRADPRWSALTAKPG
jgi:tetratricopeptide (TPR) repeat protein